MSGRDPSGALREIRTLFSDGVLGGLTDGQLLERFVNRKDSGAEDAFTVLLERHGPMVWGVCRRLVPDRDAAADAFQATFLVLVRRAGAVRVDDSLGPWLHGVSRRVATRARATSLRRRARESGGVEAAAVAGPAPDPDRAQRLAILDEEIGRLNERHGAAIVLCDLEGLPHEEAARRLGCPVGTVESRLCRARQRLRDRLVRRGLAPAAAALWAEAAHESSAAMPAALIKHTAQSVTTSTAIGAVPAAVTALAEGVIRMTWLARLKPVAAVAAVLIFATAGVGFLGRQQPQDKAERITVATVQSKAVTITQPYVCQIHAQRHINVRALENGYLGAIDVKAGQAVTKGDVMFKLVPILGQARLNAEVAEAKLAELEFDHAKGLADQKGLIPNEAARLDAKRAKAQARAQLARAELNFTDVIAPFDGIVDRPLQQEGTLVHEGETLTTLSDNTVMWVYFNVPENRYLEFMAANLDQHKDDMKVELVLASGQKFAQPGKLGAIGADFNPATGNVAFRADFPNPERLLRHGQTGTVLLSEVKPGAIVIPQRATFEVDGKRYVYVVDKDNVAHQREVTIQHELEDTFVVKTGVGVNDKIVIDGVRVVRDGDRVEFQDR
jgi:membrane fusion protein (multidrug efflux system)